MTSDAERDSPGPMLVFAPGGRDASVIAGILATIEIKTIIASDVLDLVVRLDGAAAAMFVREALDETAIAAISAWRKSQPSWSDFPFVLLTERPEIGGPPDQEAEVFSTFGNVTLVERPCYAQTLLSAARSAVRARERQLQLASELDQRRRVQTNLNKAEQRFREELEDLVRVRTTALEAETAEREQAQAALRQSQKMESIGQLTGGIAHDFNNLLVGISGSLELLVTRLAQGRLDGLERYVKTAQESARRAAALTQRLLAFSRRQTLDSRVVDANKLIQGIEELLRRSVGPDVEIEVAQAAALWRVKLDSAQLENAVLNLCINARDAMAPNGGRITIETVNKWLDEGDARDRDLPPGQYVSISVSDTGVGMAPEILEKVFDPFFTTKPLGQGTGLGLSMVYGFVRQSGGQVRLDSEVGKGTKVNLYLPRFNGAETEEQQSQPTEADRGYGETVLVIDDENAIRMLVSEVLADSGYRVLEAADGATGLAILQSTARIDLLITDVGLPGGLNGRQVADAAQVMRANLKVLFITGFAENSVLKSGNLAAGMAVITKPFGMTDLANKVRELIDA